MKTSIFRHIVYLRRPTLFAALMLLGPVWALAQVGTAPFPAPGVSSPAYPLKLSANRRYLVDQNNAPFLIAGDNPHALLGMGSTADAESFSPTARFMDLMPSG